MSTYDRVVVSPPLAKKVEALEFTDPHIPGEIKIDKAGKLLKKWLVYEGKIGSLVDTYNNWITNILPQQIASRSLTLPSGEVTFENVALFRPTIQTNSGGTIPFYPNMARESGTSYTADLRIDMVLNKGAPGEERIDKAYIGKVPIMMGSELDWLATKSEKEKVELGEGIGENSGYFNIKIQEKVILMQEKLRANRFFLFNSTSKGDVVVKITNNTLLGATQITMAQGKHSGAFKMHLGFMKRSKGPTNKLGNTMSVFQIFRMLGVADPKEILKYISLFVKPSHMKKIFVILQPTFIKLSKVGDDIEYISKKMGLGNIDYSIRKADIMNSLINELFPQLPPDNVVGKLHMLSIMTVRLAEYLIGVRDLDDRDNWGNKQLVSAGKSLELLFSAIWKELISKAQEDIDTKKLRGLKDAQRAIGSTFITDNFISSFTANNWGVQSSYMAKENITDILKRDSILSVYSHLTKINTPSSRKSKSPKLRMVQMSQLGYVDAAETQEGENCGLVKNTSLSTYMSLDHPEDVVLEMVGNYISDAPTEAFPNPFILNGIFQGWVDGPALRDFCLSLRRSLKLAKDTAIVLERDGYFNIYTDSSRPTRPLLIVDSDGVLVIEKKDLWDADFETLLREGCVEYVDAWEQESIMLAQTMEDVRYRKADVEMAMKAVREAEEKLSSLEEGKTVTAPSIEEYADRPRMRSAALEEAKKNARLMLTQAQAVLSDLTGLSRYTHSEMDPSAILSIALSIIPLPETNPGPRLTYQAGMGKQSLGIYHSGHSSRFDTTSKNLVYPSRPLFETQMNEVLGLNELPAGEMVILAITTYGGYAQEDAIIMAQGAIDRGLFRSVIYKTYRSVLTRTRNTEEKFTRPEVRKGEEDRYAAIDENGLPRLGSFVREGDCLIGKVRRNLKDNTIENASSYVEVKQEGVVDRVLVSTNAEGQRVVKVKIRQIRKPQLGDKFACYTPDHEVLTFNRGWVFIDEVTDNDLVATLENGNMEYRRPSAIQSYDYEGKMYSVSSKELDLCVTRNHRMYVKLGESFEIQTAEEIFGKEVSYCKLGGEISMEEKKEEWIDYQGKVHCCSVESGIIYVRRNRKPVWCGNSRYAQKGTIGLILPDEDMPFTAEGVRPDIIINPHCFPKDTPVSMRAGYSKKIGDFSAEGGERVWAWDEENKTFVVSFSAGMESKGIKKVVNVILLDGRKIKCTPDHRFLTEGGWVEAKDLTEETKVICGLELPMDNPEEDIGSTWKLETVEYTFDMSTFENREKALAFARIVGYLFPHLSSRQLPKFIRFCSQIDAEAFAEDIRLITSEENILSDWCVTLPNSLSDSLPDIPLFMYEEDCPKSILREFLSGFFGNKNPHMLELNLNLLLKRFDLSLTSNLTCDPNFGKQIGFRYNFRESYQLSGFLSYSRYLETHEEISFEDYFEKIHFTEENFSLLVEKIEDAGEEEVFDIGVHEQHNFLAHGCVVHNCMPSRMTIGKLIEIITSKVSAFSGERVNATAFRRFDVQEFMRNLTQYGYSSSGKERMYSGFTGKPLTARIFTGPCYYQALRHQVADKIQMRARGGVSQLTHQPVQGRKRGGGQRVGEMERDAIISHGASAFLRERLCLVSDAFETVYCSTCGMIAIANDIEGKYICRTCEEKAEFGKCKIPYAFKLLSQLLQGANYKISFRMKEAMKNE